MVLASITYQNFSQKAQMVLSQKQILQHSATTRCYHFMTKCMQIKKTIRLNFHYHAHAIGYNREKQEGFYKKIENAMCETHIFLLIFMNVNYLKKPIQPCLTTILKMPMTTGTKSTRRKSMIATNKKSKRNY